VSEPTLRDLLDQITDLGRIVARQGASVERLVDDSRAAAARARAGADIPLLVDLFVLYCDASTCASTARSRRERAAFEALGAGLERLLTGRGATVVTPSPGVAFDPASMEAAEVVATDDPALDRTVHAVLEPGLWLIDAGRSVRPARVVVQRHQPTS
jgi:molecular chaperone GrpE